MEQITASELRTKLVNGEQVIIVDVREQWEYEEIQLHPTTKNYPLGNLPKLLEQMSDLKNTSFVVYCRTGVRSNQAQKYLMKNGFNKVISLVGGLEDYLVD